MIDEFSELKCSRFLQIYTSQFFNEILTTYRLYLSKCAKLDDFLNKKTRLLELQELFKRHLKESQSN